MTIEEALEHRDTLASIAIELYGEFYITNPKFWKSPTELQMREVEALLFDENLFDEHFNPTPEEIALAEIIMEEFDLKNIFNEYYENDEDDEDEDDIV
jgi:lipopolysaccharide biosynthesis glycosyltransferase